MTGSAHWVGAAFTGFVAPFETYWMRITAQRADFVTRDTIRCGALVVTARATIDVAAGQTSVETGTARLHEVGTMYLPYARDTGFGCSRGQTL